MEYVPDSPRAGLQASATSSGADGPLGIAVAERTAPTPAAALDIRFLTAAPAVTRFVLRPVGQTYAAVWSAARRLGAPTWIARDHFLFFVFAVAGLCVLNPRILVLAQHLAERVLLSRAVVQPDLGSWPYIPAILVPVIGLAFLTFFASPTVRLRALVVGSVPLGWLSGYLDFQSVPVFAAVLLLAYAVIRSPLPRVGAACTIVALSVASLIVCWAWNPRMSLSRVVSFQAGFLPMLWYSVYEQVPPRRRLEPGKFLLYMYARFFGGPVITYADLFTPVPATRLAAIRFGGIKALYTATVAAIAVAFYEQARVMWQPESSAGLPLLLWSYGGYVATYCRLVVGFNVLIGALRLFGVPIRDNFNYWLLARTPNEHWRRWNILLREWIITFFFFPIMRARQWLFAAIMVSLLASGVLHLMPIVLIGGWDTFAVVRNMGYWLINGLAIYVVVKVPRLSPRLVNRLQIGQRWEWSVVGVVLTSAFYAVLMSLRGCHSPAEMGSYLAALAGSGVFPFRQ